MKCSFKFGKLLGIDVDTPLNIAVESMSKKKCATMPVMSRGRLVGLLTLENVTEMIMVHHAMEHHAAARH